MINTHNRPGRSNNTLSTDARRGERVAGGPASRIAVYRLHLPTSLIPSLFNTVEFDDFLDHVARGPPQGSPSSNVHNTRYNIHSNIT